MLIVDGNASNWTWGYGIIMRVKVPYFALLSTCAYIPTGRKPALNSEVHPIVTCA